MSNRPYESLDRIPPDFSLCDKHREASFMRNIILTDEDVSKPKQQQRCMCCNRISNAEEYSLKEDTNNFAIHGFGISLYFAMMRYLIYISLFLLLVSISALIIYFNGGISEFHLGRDGILVEDRVGEDDYSATYANKFSFGRVLSKEIASSILVELVILILVFYFPWVQFYRALSKLGNDLNVEYLTPADYTVRLIDLPVTEMTEKEIKNEIEQGMSINTINIPLKVFKVLFTYELTEFKEVSNEVRILRRKMIANDKAKTDSLSKKGKVHPKGYFEEKNNKLKAEYNAAMKRLEEIRASRNPMKLNKVFVSFTRPIAEEVLNRYNLGTLKYWCSDDGFKMKGRRIKVLAAPEPEDVKWENLNYSYFSRTLRVLLNAFITFCILGVCLVVNIYVVELSKKHESDSMTGKLFGISFLFSAITFIINGALCFVIPIITNFERLGSETAYYFSVSIKLSLALFLNSGIIPIITHKKDSYFINGGFLTSVWMNWLFICILNPILEVFNIKYLLSFLKWKLIRFKGSSSTLTQLEANIALEPHHVDVITQFSCVINIMFYTAFYTLLYPPGVAITILGLILQYWVSKYLMVRRYKVPRINSDIAIYSMFYIGWLFPILATISGIVFMTRFKREDTPNYLLGILLPISIIVSFFIIAHLIKFFGKDTCGPILHRIFVGDEDFSKEFLNKFESAEYNRFRFGTSDYEIANPITRNRGVRELLTYCKSYAETEEQKMMIEKFATNLRLARAMKNYGEVTRFLIPQIPYEWQSHQKSHSVRPMMGYNKGLPKSLSVRSKIEKNNKLIH